MIDILAGAPHYADHLSAVYGALPEQARGRVMACDVPTASRFRDLGLEPERPTGDDQPTLVASFGDLKRTAALGRARIAMMEHGAGQSYGGRQVRHGAYAGGRGRDGVSLFLHPGPHPANRDRIAYPNAQVEVVGSPILDTLPARIGEPGRVVAFSFHFNGTITRETRNAFTWAWPAIKELRGRYELLGHAHPRLFPHVEKLYRREGIEPVASFDDVCRRADVYVCDNSSTIFAFATTGRPVVLLDAPWYDRTVNHGLRFWDASTVGVRCGDRSTLAACIDEALEDDPAHQAAREAALDLVYSYRSGAPQRAALALMEWVA